jgi:TetR/AcrR family transcriptional regulator
MNRHMMILFRSAYAPGRRGRPNHKFSNTLDYVVVLPRRCLRLDLPTETPPVYPERLLYDAIGTRMIEATKIEEPPTDAAPVPRRRRNENRREQTRAIETRRAIMDAALNEFAERGFDGASMRHIGERAGLEYTLITYHFRTKDALWRAVAEDAFAEIEAKWNEAIPVDSQMSAADRVRKEFRTFLQFTIEHTAFHHFMLRENQVSSPRLAWLLENVLSKTRDRILPQIRAAQAAGALIKGDPNLIYYMLIGMTSVLSSLKGEMGETTGFSLDDSKAVNRYWKLIERAVFT